jgi:hypothetical protein
MPVNRLLCEGVAGGLDAVVLGALVAPDGPEVVPAFSKANLGAAVHALRRVGRMFVAAIRDRDFDCEPEPGDDPVIWKWADEAVGWQWRRHELESYLVDPELVVPASIESGADADATAYEPLLLRAARAVAPYQAARWTLGHLRRGSPPRLRSRPERFNKDFDLPIDLGSGACLAWARQEVVAHGTQLPREAAIDALYQPLHDRFIAEGFGVRDALLWFSGKDLLASVARQAQAEGHMLWSSAGALRNLVRDWIRAHPEEALRRVPEWARLKQLVKE